MAYIHRVQLTRRQVGTLLRTMIPLLTFVWSALPMHRCHIAAFAMPAAAATTTEASQHAALVAPPHCHHHDATDDAPRKPQVPCGELGRVALDQRPSALPDAAFALVTWDTHWIDRELPASAASSARRGVDEGRWRSRPLHLRNAVLLI